MSVEKVTRKSGALVWRVRWREGLRNRARTFDRKGDAMRFETEVRRRQQTGDLPPVEGGRETLGAFTDTWWQTYAIPNLARRHGGSTPTSAIATSCRASAGSHFAS